MDWRITPDERLRVHGLSHGLIEQCTSRTLVVSVCRGGGGNSYTGGFSSFPNTWETRVKPLFAWDDGIVRTNLDQAM
jgi:hypothetical protein